MLKMPRMNGSFRIFARSLPLVGYSSRVISFVLTLRTAMAVVSGPRIMMPSISACPPMLVFFVAIFANPFRVAVHTSHCILLYTAGPICQIHYSAGMLTDY